MQKLIKRYPLNQSPLYHIQRKKDLAKALQVGLSNIQKLADNPAFQFLVFDKEIEGKKSRHIAKPTGLRLRIHRRIAILLGRIAPPDYLFSAYKGKSHVDNAARHSANKHFATIDISSFFENSSEFWNKHFFLNHLKMSPDCAWLMARLLSHENHLPTGSPSSTIVSFWSHIDIFNTINQHCIDRKILFSLYVDDMTFSSETAFEKEALIQFVKQQLSSHRLRAKQKKIKVFSPNHGPNVTVTGVQFLPNGECKATNKIWKRIRKLSTQLQSCETAINTPINAKQKSQLGGLIGYTQFVRNRTANQQLK